jgi:hypothetical protein
MRWWGGCGKGRKIAIASQLHHLLGLNIKRKEENFVSRSELPGIQFLVREREPTFFPASGKQEKMPNCSQQQLVYPFFRCRGPFHVKEM